MISVNLTEQQLSLIEELVGEKFNEVAQAWLPSEQTEEMNNFCYDTLLNLRCVRLAKEFEETYANWDKSFYSFNKEQYLKDVGLVTDEELVQQGIS